MRIRWVALLLPAVVVSGGLLLASQAVFLRVSLYRDLGFGRVASDLTLANYRRFLGDAFYLKSLLLTVEISALVVACSVLVGYAAAYVLSRMPPRWATLLLAAILVTALVTEVIKVLGLIVIFSADGVVNRALLGLGLVERPLSILGTIPGVVAGILHFTLGFVILLVYGVLQTIPHSLEEAARISGATPWRAFWRVVFPLSLPGVVGAAVVVFNLSMGAFTAAALLGGGKVLTIPVLIERTMMLETKYAMAATLSAVLLLCVLSLNLVALLAVHRFQGRRPLGPGMTGVRARRWLAIGCAASFMALLYVFLFAPLVVVAGASLGPSDRPYVSFPPDSYSLATYLDIPSRYLETLGVSVALAASTAIAAATLGIPAAMALVRGRFRGRAAFAIALRIPLQIPFVVTGIAFLQLYYLLGTAVGVNPRGTFPGLLLGHLFLATPYVIGSVGAVLERFDARLEEAARSLGARPLRVFRRVTLPLLMPGVYAGALYAFIVSFGEVPVALFLASPAYTTFPVELFASMQFDFNPALLAISTLILVLSLALLVVLQRLIGLDTVLRAGTGRS